MSQVYKDLFEYNDLKIEGRVRLSPSLLPQFYENSKSWFRKAILKEDVFNGNTNTVAGTIIHARIASVWLGIEFNEDDEAEYLLSYVNNAEVDSWKVVDAVRSLWSIVPSELKEMQVPDKIEESASFNIPNSVYTLSGTYDYLRTKDKTIGDIKTTSVTPKQIKFGHKYQIYLYELIRRMNRLEPMKTIEVMYLVKTKTPKCVVLSEPIDEEFMSWVKEEIKKMIKRLDICQKDSDMIELMFHPNPNSYMK